MKEWYATIAINGMSLPLELVIAVRQYCGGSSPKSYRCRRRLASRCGDSVHLFDLPTMLRENGPASQPPHKLVVIGSSASAAQIALDYGNRGERPRVVIVNAQSVDPIASNCVRFLQGLQLPRWRSFRYEAKAYGWGPAVARTIAWWWRWGV